MRTVFAANLLWADCTSRIILQIMNTVENLVNCSWAIFRQTANEFSKRYSSVAIFCQYFGMLLSLLRGCWSFFQESLSYVNVNCIKVSRSRWDTYDRNHSSWSLAGCHYCNPYHVTTAEGGAECRQSGCWVLGMILGEKLREITAVHPDTQESVMQSTTESN